MLTDDVDFDLLGKALGEDVKSAIREALARGAVFPTSRRPLQVLQDTLNTAIREIETHPMGLLFQRFLRDGPYEREGDIPPELRDQRLSDHETAKVITYVYSYMVNCFKGAVAELLAAGAVSRWLKEFSPAAGMPENARLYAGDSVMVKRSEGRGMLKGPDLAILFQHHDPETIGVAGVVEVKSYSQTEDRLRKQLDRHIAHSGRGLWIAGREYAADRVRIGYGSSKRVARIAVLPDDWELPRTFHFETSGGSRFLHTEEGQPVHASDQVEQTGPDEWRITLRWSREALAAAAYEMTFWYMEKVGEILYSEGLPKEWKEMTPAEAGRNAAKMMLHYAILRCRGRIEQRAIALYNSYGFGYALGMNFINAEGKRAMLWPEDLDEILDSGQTKHGCRIRP